MDSDKEWLPSESDISSFEVKRPGVVPALPDNRPDQSNGDRPLQFQDGPADQPQDDPTDQSQDDPTDQSQDDPADQPQDGPADQPQDGPADQPQGGPADQPQDRPANQPQDGPANQESPEKRGRKRVRTEENWKRNKRKELRNRGKSYVSSRNNDVQEKVFATIDCNCRNKCLESFENPEQLKKFFDTFWGLGDRAKQNAFLRGMIGKFSPIRSRPRDGSAPAKTTIFQYLIPGAKEDQKVCKKFFLSLLQISWGRLYRCVTGEEAFGVIDGRGKNTPYNKIDDSEVVAHIKSFPAYQSHYTRKDNASKKYLNPDLNIRKMYDLYVQKCTKENKQPVKLKYYYNVFSSKFNLHFKPPSKDTCKDCDKFELMIDAENDEATKEDLKKNKDNHLAQAEDVRKELDHDQKSVSDDTYVCTYDLQKALPIPKLSTSVAYYKRNIYVYNFGVHCSNDSIGHMYVYDETEGGRGAEDISSCLTKHLKEHAKDYKHVVLFSDSCGGQNRNIKISLAMLRLVQDPERNFETIDLKYMVPGHSFLPNDTDFGMIERASKKNHQIFVPANWIDTIKSAKRKEPQFKVHLMNRDEFFSTKALEEVVNNRKKATDGEAVNWLKIRWLRFQKGKPFQIMFKHTFKKDEPFRIVNLKQEEDGKRRKNAKPNKGLKLNTLLEVRPTLLYPTRRPVTLAKKNDMLSLLPYIPTQHHSFFRNLPLVVGTRSNSSENNEESDDNDEIDYED